MTTEDDCIFEDIDGMDDIPVRKPQFKGDDGHWRCGECAQRLNEHLDSCRTNQAFKAWYRNILDKSETMNNKPRPEWMCKGCDQPSSGPHRFGCYLRGGKSQQTSLSVERSPDGTFKVTS